MPTSELLGGFNIPTEPRDEWAASLFEKHGLSETPSLEEIEPIAKSLWDDVRSRFEVAELILGRRVDAEEFRADPIFGRILLLEDKEKAFGCFLLYREIDLHPVPDNRE